VNILIATDSFKGSISSKNAARAIQEGIKRVKPDVVCHSFPLADGGEGTLETIVTYMESSVLEDLVPNALGHEITAKRGVFDDGKTAVIELAQASGIGGLLHPDGIKASTYGTGLQIKKALEDGARKIIFTLGGSATVDGGAGIMSALGARFYERKNKECKAWHNHLYYFRRADFSGLDKRADKVKWLVLADVNNQVLGKEGGIRTFGPQKGLNNAAIRELEQKVVDWTRAMGGLKGEECLRFPGSGAAGGAALPLLVRWDAVIQNGFDWIATNFGLEEMIKKSDLVITGEGKLDLQTSMGKGPYKIARLAVKYGKRVVAIAGTAETRPSIFNEIFTLDTFCHSKVTLMDKPEYFLRLAGQKIMHEIA
jgi:glycerate kinase